MGQTDRIQCGISGDTERKKEAQENKGECRMRMPKWGSDPSNGLTVARSSVLPDMERGKGGSRGQFNCVAKNLPENPAKRLVKG